ncbi:hypothetical protein ACFQV8_38940 [Pseudonocardia benzenivorans]
MSASVGTVTCTEAGETRTGVGGPVTRDAGTLPGSTLPRTPRYSSVVYGLSPASHCADVVPDGWLTQAAAQEAAAARACGGAWSSGSVVGVRA